MSDSGDERIGGFLCHTPLTYQSTRWPGEVHILVCASDAPKTLAPNAHVMSQNRSHGCGSPMGCRDSPRRPRRKVRCRD